MVDKLFKGMRVAEQVICGVVFMAALTVLTANVIVRGFFSGAISWAEEFMRYAMIWVTFFGCALCAEDNLHVGIDVFVQMGPPWLRKVLKIFAMACSFVFCALMVEFSWRNTMLLMETSQKAPIMQIPMWIVYVCMPVGIAMSALQFGRKMVQYIRMKPAEFANPPEEQASDEGDIDMLTLN